MCEAALGYAPPSVELRFVRQSGERAEEPYPPSRPWQCLYFRPDPHGHSALRPAFRHVLGSFGSTAPARIGCAATAIVAAPEAAPSSAISGSRPANAETGSGWLSTTCIRCG